MSEEFTIQVANRVKRLPPYLFGRLNALKYEKRRNNIDVIDLGMGNPNDPTPQPIIQKLCDAVQDPRNHRYTVSANGIYNLRREIAKYYEKQFNVLLDPDEVVCTIGSKEGISHLCLGLLETGDIALVPNPAFPIHIHAVNLAGGSVVSVPLSAEEDFLPNLFNTARSLIPKPKIIILNFPHNPTAATVDLDFFEKIVAFAKKHNIIIVHDFAYCEITFDGYKAPSFLQAKGAKEVGVEFNTMSKSFNMAGWRLGFCVGNKEIVSTLAKVKGYYDYGIFQPVQIASIIALRECNTYAKEQAKIYQTRRDILCDGLNRIGWNIKKPKASMFVWAPIPEKYRSMGSVDFAFKLINEAEVAVAPGIAFGENGEGYLRLALVENELRLKQAIRQIDRVLK
ncbi:MAG: aminotransferase class I/II-fold pyridoxal phosphate-dependent enzyme [Candidatus Loosdrechtia sp.]|uniref:aminotransferase class I/II-fold pyridoxal phosphate-dependent enzyme n=1 Tax=Candidatus Loosdrechtia sp. TaxID=3101272 RepID=UPI003A6A3A61|nr:MAG: aminotransferase class I/II-fold pyridoxal phosphate-dependent enzyme [Candidatus Jettenia sp. AMX2]